jgi:hypothetical protein
MKSRTAIALAAGVFAAVAVTGTALAVGADDPASSPSSAAPEVVFPSPSDDGPSPDDSQLATVPPIASSAPSSSSSPPADSSAATSISQAQAERIAIGATGGGRVTKAERETEHGRPVYHFRVLAGGAEYRVDVDRETGAVLRLRSEGSDDRSGGSVVGSSDDSGHHGGGHGSDDSSGHGGHGSDD